MNQFSLLEDIPYYKTWKKIRPINKGWSLDKKFYIENGSKDKLLLRLSDIGNYQSKQKEFETIKALKKLEINGPQALDFGLCGKDTCTYSLYTWVEGEDAEDILQTQSTKCQYEHGIKAGKMLQKIHTIAAPLNQKQWETRYTQKIQQKIRDYKKCGITIEHGAQIIRFLENNLSYLANRPQVLQHGDFHVGNFVISRDNILGLIDFNRMDYGDPWEEFNRIVFSWRVSVPFAVGQIHGYFNNHIPDLFFRLMAVYITTNTIGSITWAQAFGEDEIEFMRTNAREIIKAYDGFSTYVPKWYHAPN